MQPPCGPLPSFLIAGATLLLLLLHPQVVVRAQVTSYSAVQLNNRLPAYLFEQDSRFLTGGSYYGITFNEPPANDLTIAWPGTTTTASEDGQTVKLEVLGCFACPLLSYTWPANESWQHTLPGVIAYRELTTVFITLLRGNGTKAWSDAVTDLNGLTSFDVKVSLTADNHLESVKAYAVTTRLYTCQWATQAHVSGFVDDPLSPSSSSTILQAPVVYSDYWGWYCEVPWFEDRVPAVAHFTMSLLVGSGPDTVPPADGVPIVKPTKARVLSIPSASGCLRPGSFLYIIGVFNTSALYSCDFSTDSSDDSIVDGSSGWPVNPQSQWDLLCEIPTSITRNQFISLRVAVWEWLVEADDPSAERERVLVGGDIFYSSCPRESEYSDSFWCGVVAVLVAAVSAVVVIMRHRVHNACRPVVALELTSV